MLNLIALILNNIANIFDMYCRSKGYTDIESAIKYLGDLLKETNDPRTLTTLTKFQIRQNPEKAEKIIDNYITTMKKIIPKEEITTLYYHLGTIYPMKSLNTHAREYIEQIVSQKIEAIQQFILATYQETLKQYPLTKK